ncbi:MAG: hypothetical protein A2X94_01485 [Bdellovibrionales bacterium GWB1_55_8]|nr:MAG: hypothetical protein A2X94_01485 [Bdellovibrionales bacterium GWB1_55_8]
MRPCFVFSSLRLAIYNLTHENLSSNCDGLSGQSGPVPPRAGRGTLQPGCRRKLQLSFDARRWKDPGSRGDGRAYLSGLFYALGLNDAHSASLIVAAGIGFHLGYEIRRILMICMITIRQETESGRLLTLSLRMLIFRETLRESSEPWPGSLQEIVSVDISNHSCKENPGS